MVKKIDPKVKKMSPKDKKKHLKNEIALVNKKFGKDVIQFGFNKEISRIPFKSNELNKITGGGIPCFAAGTKVLMSDYSNVCIENIKKGDTVLTFNEKTYRLEKSKVTKTYKSISDKIVYIKSTKSDVITTKDHPFLCCQSNGERLWHKAIHTNRYTQFYHIPQNERTLEWKKGWILGALMSDGNLQRYKFTFYNTNLKLLKYFAKNVEEVYGINSKIANYKNDNTFRININSIGIVNILKKQIDSLNKNDNIDFLRGYLAGYFDGDGGMGKRTRVRYYSSDLKRINTLSKTLKKLGFKSSKYKISEEHTSTLKGKNYVSKPKYCLSVNKTLNWLFTCTPYTKNISNLSLHRHTMDTHKVLFKAIPNRKNDRKKISIKVYNIETTSGTYIANGFPVHNCGRFSVLWGSKGSAKTTACYDLVAKAQEMDKTCLWIDLERSFSPTWASTMGVDVDSLLIAPSFDTAEEAMDAIIKLTREKVIDMIIIDSIQGLSPKGEQETKKGVEKSVEDDTMALLARKLSQFFRISSSGVAQSNCTVVLIGQTRMDLGSFVTLEKLSGGRALEHWSSLTIHFRRGKKANAPARNKKTGNLVKGSNKDAEIYGFELVAKVNKSKVGPDEGKEARFPFFYKEGMKNEISD